ncbi:MAG: HAMP domain-containing protein [Candidatus Omnitrophica bacterium]|nr:HAMP domain-containing protein [Candidatus Omnitrophota bacterium]
MKALEKYFIRKRILIEKKLQFKYAGVILVMVLASCALIILTVYFSCWYSLTEENASVQTAAAIGNMLNKLNLMILFELPILLVIAASIGIVLSHKIAGPVYRLQKAARDVSHGDLTISVSLRSNDELRNLSDAFNSVIENMRRLVSKDKKLIFELSQITNNLYASLKDKKINESDALALIRKLNDLVGELKTLILQYKIEKG